MREKTKLSSEITVIVIAQFALLLKYVRNQRPFKSKLNKCLFYGFVAGVLLL